MTNREKLIETFGDVSLMSTLNDLRKWLGDEYKEPEGEVIKIDRDDDKPVQYVTQRDGQLSFLKDKELYYFEGWACFRDPNGYDVASDYKLYTHAKSEAQALNNIKAQIKKLNNLPYNWKVDISLDDGVSTLTKQLPPISEYRLVHPSNNDVEIRVKARNVKDVYDKLQECNIYLDNTDFDIQLGGIANEEDNT